MTPRAGIAAPRVAGGRAGPCAAARMADPGAGVIGVERAGGDAGGHVGPVRDGARAPVPGVSGPARAVARAGAPRDLRVFRIREGCAGIRRATIARGRPACARRPRMPTLSSQRARPER